MRQLTVDRPLGCPAGAYTVQLSITDTGLYRVETLSPGAVAQAVDALTRSFESESLARTVARIITLALRKDGATVETASAAVAQFFAAQPVLDSEPVGLEALACLGERRQVRPTMAGAHLAPITKPQRYALASAYRWGGVIQRGKYTPVHLLRSMARKGLVTLIYREGSRRPDPVSATLTALGWREAQAMEAVA